MSLKIGGGNFVPKGFRGEGSYKLIDDKTLELRGVYLGSREKDAGSAANRGAPCRYLFILSSRPQ